MPGAIAVRVDGASVQFRQVPGNRQPEPEAGMHARAAPVGLCEPVEDQRPEALH